VNFTVIDAPQRSEEWFQVRAGRLTGSCANDMLATIKNGEAAARRDLRLRLVCERLTGLPQEDGFCNVAMQRGIDKEADAIAAYEALTGNLLLTSGFLLHDELMAGCSLDGHVEDFAGIVEVKCPKSATHLRYLRDGRVPAEHLPQITHNLWISGAAWCDFFSWDDRFHAPLQTMLVRVYRTEVDIGGYARKAVAFLEEVDREYAAVQGWRVLEVAS
jgi:hypothetical protein